MAIDESFGYILHITKTKNFGTTEMGMGGTIRK